MSNTVILRKYTGLRWAGTQSININTSDCLAGSVLLAMRGSWTTLTVGGKPVTYAGGIFQIDTTPQIGASVPVAITGASGLNSQLWGDIYVLSYGDQVVDYKTASGSLSATANAISRPGAMGFWFIYNPPSPGPYITTSSIGQGYYAQDDIRYGDGGDGRVCMSWSHKVAVDTNETESFTCTINTGIGTEVQLLMLAHNVTGKPFSISRRG